MTIPSFLTAKGRRIGATATEFNWNVPIELYNSLPLEGLPVVRKIRHYWKGRMASFGKLTNMRVLFLDLIIAEVELDSEDQEVIVPDWVGLELTHLKGWSNSSLSRMIMDSELN